jgi:3-oxoacyl-[acyl-carrier protein] reductase
MTSEQRVAVVTGGARGIGATIARRLADDDMAVFVLDRDVAGAGDEVSALVCDITSDADVGGAVARIVGERGRIDVLVNNAGVNLTGPLETTDLEAFERCLSINVTGLLRVCQAVIPVMRAGGSGRIINAASFAAIIPAVGGGAYAASKAAVVQLSRALAGELGPAGITVNSYAPGMVPTAMNGFADMEEEVQDRLLDTLTIRRWGTPEEVADLVSFLASPRSGYITGTLIDVSGGKLATQIPRVAYETDAARGTGSAASTSPATRSGEHSGSQ